MGRIRPPIRLVRYLAACHHTGTTIVTVLMVFVIQNTQSRDTQAMQLKLDELIRVNEIARNSLINLEEMSEADVERLGLLMAGAAA